MKDITDPFIAINNKFDISSLKEGDIVFNDGLPLTFKEKSQSEDALLEWDGGEFPISWESLYKINFDVGDWITINSIDDQGEEISTTYQIVGMDLFGRVYLKKEGTSGSLSFNKTKENVKLLQEGIKYDIVEHMEDLVSNFESYDECSYKKDDQKKHYFLFNPTKKYLSYLEGAPQIREQFENIIPESIKKENTNSRTVFKRNDIVWSSSKQKYIRLWDDKLNSAEGKLTKKEITHRFQINVGDEFATFNNGYKFIITGIGDNNFYYQSTILKERPAKKSCESNIDSHPDFEVDHSSFFTNSFIFDPNFTYRRTKKCESVKTKLINETDSHKKISDKRIAAEKAKKIKEISHFPSLALSGISAACFVGGDYIIVNNFWIRVLNSLGNNSAGWIVDKTKINSRVIASIGDLIHNSKTGESWEIIGKHEHGFILQSENPEDCSKILNLECKAGADLKNLGKIFSLNLIHPNELNDYRIEYRDFNSKTQFYNQTNKHKELTNFSIDFIVPPEDFLFQRNDLVEDDEGVISRLWNSEGNYIGGKIDFSKVRKVYRFKIGDVFVGSDGCELHLTAISDFHFHFSTKQNKSEDTLNSSLADNSDYNHDTRNCTTYKSISISSFAKAKLRKIRNENQNNIKTNRQTKAHKEALKVKQEVKQTPPNTIFLNNPHTTYTLKNCGIIDGYISFVSSIGTCATNSTTTPTNGEKNTVVFNKNEDKKENINNKLKEPKDAAFRIAARKVNQIGQKAILKACASLGYNKDQQGLIATVLQSDYGRSLISYGLGTALEQTPIKDKRLERLNDELRIEGIAGGIENITNDLLSILNPNSSELNESEKVILNTEIMVEGTR